MERVDYSEMNKTEWNQFVDNNSEGWFWHRSEFIDAWPYCENHSFAMTENGKILAVCILRWNKIRIDGIRNAYKRIVKRKVYSTIQSEGWNVVSDEVTAKKRRKIISFYKEYLDSLVARCDTSFEARLPELAPAYLEGGEWHAHAHGVNPMLWWGFSNASTQAYILDLHKDAEQIFREMSETSRQEIRNIQNDNSYKVIEAQPNETDLDIFYGLHRATCTRTSAGGHSKSMYEHILCRMMPAGFCRVIFMQKDGQVIAAQNTLVYKNMALYWTGSSVDQKENGVNKALMYNQIMWCREKGCRYYEIGEAFPEIRSGKLKGLTTYKQAFGGGLIPVYKGIYNKNQ